MKDIAGKLPRFHVYTLKLLGLLLVIQTALRLAFYLKFDKPLDPITRADALQAFYLGLKYDLRVSLIVLLPLLLLGGWRPLHPVYSTFGRRLWFGYTALVLILMALLFATDFGHYAYLEQRLNATALRFLENPWISATMVWETYPVITGAVIIALLIYLCLVFFRILVNRIEPKPGQYSRWYQKALIALVTFFIVVFALYGKFSWYPLRWSDAFFSTHAFSAQLASHPALYYFNTFKNREESFNLEATRAYYPLMADYLGVSAGDADALNFRRESTYDSAPATPPNVIIVILESFASYKTSLSGNPVDPTPNFARLASEGYYFRNFFVPHTGTARSVWATVTGLPDLEKTKTSTRNPLIVDQHTIINAFKDHSKFYFLGGSASWANIRGLLASNIPGLELYEEGSYASPRVDVWGISDLDLFREAHAVLQEQQGPFFAIIQTSGNHRPYTIPEDNAGFVIQTGDDLDAPVTEYGFISLEEYNAFRFMDHSIGEFLRLAEHANYADNTLFIFFGDHGIQANTGRHTPDAEAQLGLNGLRVPLVLYGRRLITEPRVFDKIASQVDVLPTIADLTRTGYVNTTLGRSLLDERFDDRRYAFTIEHGATRAIGLLDGDYYVRMNFDGGDAHLHRLSAATPRDDIAAAHPELTQKMKDYTLAIKETAMYMREHNRPAGTD